MSQRDGETVSAVLPADTFDSFESYRETRDLSKSQAGKRLIRDGLRNTQLSLTWAAEHTVSAGVFITIGLAIFSAVVFVLAVAGFGVGSDPQALLEVAVTASYSTLATAVIAAVGLKTGFVQWLDEKSG